MARNVVFDHASLSVETHAGFQVGRVGHNSVHIATFMCKGDFDGAHAKLQIGASTSAGTLRWNDIASTTLSADGVINVEVAPGFYIRPFLYGMSAAASQSTSVDGWLSFGAYVK